MQLNVGGTFRFLGWTVLNIAPGPHVDIVGDCSDLGMIQDNTCERVYASHVLEHLGYDGALQRALAEIFRVLKPGAELLASVPDMDILCDLYRSLDLSKQERFDVMRMMFGGRSDAHDVHLVGLNFELLQSLLRQAGFRQIDRVESLGWFHDGSEHRFRGQRISLNVVARKPLDA